MITPINMTTDFVIENLTIDIPTNGSEIVSQIPLLANQNTNHWFALIILSVLWVILFWVFADRTQFSEFKYSDSRAVNLAFGVCSIFGITNIQIGFYTDLQGVMMFITLFMLSWFAILFFENRE